MLCCDTEGTSCTCEDLIKSDVDNDEHLCRIRDRWNERSTLKNDYYDQLFDGTGYLTVGYYKTWNETLGESVINMTARLVEISAMGPDPDARILDLGCGRGGPLLDAAAKKKCELAVGIDLSRGNINMARTAAERYMVEHKMSLLPVEFHVGSYYSLHRDLTNSSYTHVMMQTSLFYGHHRIDEVLSNVAAALVSGGIFVATDFYCANRSENMQSFIDHNKMLRILTLEELKAALLRNGMEYVGGENLDKHCIKCNNAKVEKIERENIQVPSTEIFKARAKFVAEGKVTFQIVMAKKV